MAERIPEMLTHASNSVTSYFVEAYSFAFDLADIGRYYRGYVELMAHFDGVYPGRVYGADANAGSRR